jgi:hypothetical protein
LRRPGGGAGAAPSGTSPCAWRWSRAAGPGHLRYTRRV